VPIQAICEGPIIYKKWTSGYGGLVVQSCQIEKQAVTVTYGHLNIDTVGTSLDTILQPSDHIGMLGKGYSDETAGERKHLHLAIHK